MEKNDVFDPVIPKTGWRKGADAEMTFHVGVAFGMVQLRVQEVKRKCD